MSRLYIEKYVKDTFEEQGMVTLLGYDRYMLTYVSKMFNGNVHAEKHTVGRADHIQIVSEKELFRNDDVPWHADWSYGPGSYDGTALYCEQDFTDTPTYFCDMRSLYELAIREFGKDEVERLRNVKGVYAPPNDLKYCFNDETFDSLANKPKRRPIVFDHPITSEPTMYFSPGTLIDVEGGHFDMPNYVELMNAIEFPVKWNNGKIVVWDNLRYHHRRPAFEGSRELLRIQFKYVGRKMDLKTTRQRDD